MNNKKTQEQLFNRILINIGIAIAAYIFLYVIYAKYYLSPAIPSAICCFILAAAGYVLSAAKVIKVRNYAHMFLAFGLALMFTRLSVLVGNAVGIERFMAIKNSSRFMNILFNSRYDVILITWLGIIYLVLMLIYNSVLISRAGKKKK